MNTSRHKRLGRIAACTALALAAGTALAGTAAADGSADRPHGTVTEATPKLDRLPGSFLPEGSVRRGALAAGQAGPVRFDADGDGIPDLLYRAINRKYFVNPGGAADHYEYTVGDQAGSVEYKDVIPVGNVDSDGLTDVVTLTNDGTLGLFLSNTKWGTNTYSTWSGKGWSAYNKVFSAGDLNGDGRVDLLARTPAGALYLYRGTGNVYAPFSSASKVGSGWEGYDQLFGAGDLNGDGKHDLLARTPGGDLYRYTGTGSSASPFKTRAKIGYGYQGYNQLVGLEDIHGDGKGDMLARTTSGQTYVYRGNGTGGFQARVTGQDGWNVATLFSSQGGNPTFGRTDLMGRDTDGTLWWYYSKNNGTLGARQRISKVGGWKGAKITWSSSLDNVNNTEVLEVANGGHLYVNGNDIGAGWGAYNTLVGPGDLSGDGKGDLLARDGSGNLYLYQGRGTGSFTSRVRIGAGWSGFNKLIGAGDLTGDGRGDLIARATNGTLYLYPGSGMAKAPFKTRVKIGTGYGVYKNLVVPGDLTGDGRADLLGSDSAGNLWRYTSYGSGKLTARAKVGTGYQIYPNLY